MIATFIIWTAKHQAATLAVVGALLAIVGSVEAPR